ncbi:UDP-N-acetylmuramoyl-tripeptide--D-alanyl-D-alanine ligase, partial [Halochromatium sp.]
AGVGIDSRGIEADQAFVAIAGERFDGHDFIAEVEAKGAMLAIVERDLPPPSAGRMAVLKVPSTLAALQTLASDWRDRLGDAGCRIISVSGSNGKTTTRHLIHHVLTDAGYDGTQSPKSFNNQLGVPLTLLAGRADHDFLVAEIGTNHPGEIAALAAIVRPDIAVVTSIGEEHLEFFHDLNGVAREESQVLEHLAEDGVAILPSPEHLAAPLTLPSQPRFRVQHFDLDPVTAELALRGAHNRLNASAASAVARLIEIDDTRIASAWPNASAAPLRGEIIAADDAGRPTVINDAYNANPTSMRAALALLAEYPAPRWAVLGDMLELGTTAPAAHRAIMSEAALVCERCVLIGEQFAAITDAVPADAAVEVHAAWSGEVAAQIAAEIGADTTLLIKGSRGMALERLLPALDAQFGPAA